MVDLDDVVYCNPSYNHSPSQVTPARNVYLVQSSALTSELVHRTLLILVSSWWHSLYGELCLCEPFSEMPADNVAKSLSMNCSEHSIHSVVGPQ